MNKILIYRHFHSSKKYIFTKGLEKSTEKSKEKPGENLGEKLGEDTPAYER